MDDDSDCDSDSSDESSESSDNSSEEEEEDEEEEEEEEEEEFDLEEDFSDSELMGFASEHVPPCYEAIHGTAVVRKKSSGRKKKVSFPSGEKLVLIHVIPNRKMLGLHSESDSDSSEDSDDEVKVKRTTSKPITNNNGECKRFAKKAPEKIVKVLPLSNTNNNNNAAKSRQKRQIRRPTSKLKQDQKESQKTTNPLENTQNVNDIKEFGKQKRRTKGFKKTACKTLNKLDKTTKRKSARIKAGRTNFSGDCQQPRTVTPNLDRNDDIAIEGITLSSKNKVQAGVIKVSKDKDFIETLTYNKMNGFISSRETEKSDYPLGKKHIPPKQEKRQLQQKGEEKSSSKSGMIAYMKSKKDAQLLVTIQAKQPYRKGTPRSNACTLNVGYHYAADLLRYCHTNNEIM